MLDRLAVLGMALAEETVKRAVESPYHPEMKHDPGRSFAQVSRAVRFTLALQARVQKEILALRNGFVMEPKVSAPTSCTRRKRVREALMNIIDREHPEGEGRQTAVVRFYENLIEREDYEDLLDLPFRDCVEAICADLGLAPDWCGWSDELEFKPSPTPEVGRVDSRAAARGGVGEYRDG